MTDQKKLRIAYWTSTLIFAIPIAWSAAEYFREAPAMMQTMSHLGYPVYFTKILGTAKVTGVAALLLADRLPALARDGRLKEWAYAGFTFDLLGACASHLSSGDGPATASVPILFFIPLAISYFAWHRLRARTLQPAVVEDRDHGTIPALRKVG